MSEWWTYRLSDFLMFSPRTYYRLVELYNLDTWPRHLLGLCLGGAVLCVAWLARTRAAPLIWATLGACWIWVAWAFLWQWYATINWAATWFAVGFAIEAALLILTSGLAARRLPAGVGSGIRLARGLPRAIGIALAIVALTAQPWIALLVGRPWQQAEVFGLAPDPTALATLGLLLIMQPRAKTSQAEPPSGLWWLLWLIPILWCLVSGATSWAMAAPETLLMPCAGLVAILAAWRGQSDKTREFVVNGQGGADEASDPVSNQAQRVS